MAKSIQEQTLGRMKTCALLELSSYEMKIITDNELTRHLIFAHPEIRHASFTLISWEGGLCFSQGAAGLLFADPSGGPIDLYYALSAKPEVQFHGDPPIRGEKAIRLTDAKHLDKMARYLSAGMPQIFSVERFESEVRSALKWRNDSFKRRVDAAILKVLDYDGFAARSAAYRFVDRDDCCFEPRPFRDLALNPPMDYSPRFIYACLAVVWGIQQYQQHQHREEKNRNKKVPR